MSDGPGGIDGGRGMRVGAVCWALSAAYFLVELIVAQGWPTYSFASQTISDLGATSCDDLTRSGQPVSVCSPHHVAMNLGFIVVGILTAAGAVLTRAAWPRTRATSTAVVLLVLSGLGAVAVGLAPQDVFFALHAVGAGLQFPASLAPLLLGPAILAARPVLAPFSIVVGVVGGVGSVLFLTGVLADQLGVGTLERLAIWPLTVWTAVTGISLLLQQRREQP